MRYFALTWLLTGAAIALTPAEWRNQSIYFLLTDRFGREDNSTTAACDVSQRVCTTPSILLCGLISCGRFTAAAVGKAL